jgi:hypothetical protein
VSGKLEISIICPRLRNRNRSTRKILWRNVVRVCFIQELSEKGGSVFCCAWLCYKVIDSVLAVNKIGDTSYGQGGNVVKVRARICAISLHIQSERIVKASPDYPDLFT